MASLATAEDLADYLGSAPANAAQVTFALDAASAFTRAYCGWSITRETGVEWTRDAAGGRLLAVPTLHLVSVSSVLVDGVERVAEIELSESGLLYLAEGWPNALGSVLVQATHGYEESPRDVLAVVCSLASRLLATSGKGAITGYRVGGVQVNYGREGAESVGLSTVEQLALNRYRLPGAP